MPVTNQLLTSVAARDQKPLHLNHPSGTGSLAGPTKATRASASSGRSRPPDPALCDVRW